MSGTAAGDTPGAATITVRRLPVGWRDRGRAHHVVIDGHGVAKLKRGRLFEITVTPGPHTVQMTIDWCSSPVVHVDLDVGCDVTLTCGPSSVPSREVMFGGRGATAKYISLELDAE